MKLLDGLSLIWDQRSRYEAIQRRYGILLRTEVNLKSSYQHIETHNVLTCLNLSNIGYINVM